AGRDPQLHYRLVRVVVRRLERDRDPDAGRQDRCDADRVGSLAWVPEQERLHGRGLVLRGHHLVVVAVPDPPPRGAHASHPLLPYTCTSRSTLCAPRCMTSTTCSASPPRGPTWAPLSITPAQSGCCLNTSAMTAAASSRGSGSGPGSGAVLSW